MSTIRLRPPFPAAGSDQPGLLAQDQSRGLGPHKVAADLRPVARAALRSLMLLGLAILLVLVLLPAAFVAAGT